MTDVDQHLLAELEVRAVLERYCSLLDAGAVGDLLELFEDDCPFTMLRHTYTGKSEFTDVWNGIESVDRPSTLHALVNPAISVECDEATAASGWILLDRAGAGPSAQVSLAGRYHDALRHASDRRWRFTTRRVETLARAGSRSPGLRKAGVT